MVRLLVFVSICLVYSSSLGQTFGLKSCETKYETKTMYGLQVKVANSPKNANDSTSLVSAAEPVAVPSVVSSTQKVSVVRRARAYWTEGGRPWNYETIRVHLIKHQVPSSQLSLLTFKEMVDAHDNIHEGFTWSGVQRTVTVQAYQSSCPGGVCPTPSYQPRRLFRR